jgi:hypothetical protein
MLTHTHRSRIQGNFIFIVAASWGLACASCSVGEWDGSMSRVLYDMIWYCWWLPCAVWYDMILFMTAVRCMIWYDIVHDCRVLYDMIWHDIVHDCHVLYDMIWYDIVHDCRVLYDMIWHDIVHDCRMGPLTVPQSVWLWRSIDVASSLLTISIHLKFSSLLIHFELTHHLHIQLSFSLST